MPSVVVIEPQIKEKQRGGGGAQYAPRLYFTKIPQPE